MSRVHMDDFFMSMGDEEALKNPLLVVGNEKSGSRYARAVGCKGLGEGGSMDWLIEAISNILKSWGHAGGRGGELMVKSDGEPAMVAVTHRPMQTSLVLRYLTLAQPQAKQKRRRRLRWCRSRNKGWKTSSRWR